eukprot:1477115-Prymnesium_polylepis.1
MTAQEDASQLPDNARPRTRTTDATTLQYQGTLVRRRAMWAAQDDYLLGLSTTIDMYLVPEAPQSRVALEYRLMTHHRP